jgi:myo-inositol 2-dehydrogenase / D-chiro-inositol 1-dehydrogenase
MTELNRRHFLGATGTLVAGHVLTSPMSSPAAAAGPGEKVNVGVIGIGSRGSVLLKTLLTIPGVAVRALCDIDAGHLDRAVKEVVSAGQDKPDATDEWKRLLEMKGIDAVVSALPCDLHAANYLDVLAAGKDLYGEKPMCLTPGDCDKVVAAAGKSKQIVQIGHQRRADPRFIETMSQIREGELGEMVEGRILWSNSWGPLLGWFGRRERSGDWIVEQAVHNWDVMNWACQGLPVRAAALGRDDLFRSLQSDRNVHDYYSGVVEYPNGVIVNIIHSWVAPTKFNEEYTRIIGTKGGVDFNSGLFSYRPDQKRADRVGHSHPGVVDNTKLALEAFVDCVHSRKPPFCRVEHGRDAVLACLLVREAVDSKRVATMKELVA